MESTIQKKQVKLISKKKILNVNTPFAIVEAYNTLRTNLMFTKKGDVCPIYIVTSPLPNEGKSLNTVNLAISFTNMDQKTLIIDMDMRNPTIHQLLGLSLHHGVSEYLAGLDESLEYKATNFDNLKVITAGQIPPNPADLLSNASVIKLLSHVRKDFNYVFIDMPPTEVVADATILSKLVTGYLLVVKKDRSDLLLLKHTISVLEQVEAKIVGLILNYVNFKEQKKYRMYAHKKS